MGTPHLMGLRSMSPNRRTMSQGRHKAHYRVQPKKSTTTQQMFTHTFEERITVLEVEVPPILRITCKFNIQHPNDHRTASAPLYSPPTSQLTSAEPRTRSGKPVRQPPRVTGLSQSEGTNTPVRHRSYTARILILLNVLRPLFCALTLG